MNDRGRLIDCERIHDGKLSICFGRLDLEPCGRLCFDPLNVCIGLCLNADCIRNCFGLDDALHLIDRGDRRLFRLTRLDGSGAGFDGSGAGRYGSGAGFDLVCFVVVNVGRLEGRYLCVTF